MLGKNYFKQNLLIATYGAVLPIPKNYAKTTSNVYSCKDGATLPRVKSYLASLGKKAEDYNFKNFLQNRVKKNTILPYLTHHYLI